METFEGRVAVVTGAASGMGLAFARRFASEGMRVVLADVETKALDLAVASILEAGGQAIGVATDVSQPQAVEALAERAYSEFGAVHVLCNNAGVMADGDLGDVAGSGEGATRIWEQTLEEWHWTFGVNFWGVVHGIRSFVPRMLAGGEQGHIVNTASIAGVTAGALVPIYGATKHGVVRVSESLYLQLQQEGAPIGVTVLCPSAVDTRIATSSRNRPEGLWGEEARLSSADLEQRQRQWEQRAAAIEAITPEQVAGMVLEAICGEKFYLLTHPGSERGVETRMKNIVLGRNPR